MAEKCIVDCRLSVFFLFQYMVIDLNHHVVPVAKQLRYKKPIVRDLIPMNRIIMKLAA